METNRRTQTTLGLVAAAAIAMASESLQQGGFLLLLATVFILTVTGMAGGQRLPLWIRLFTTALCFYLGYAMSLAGRTMRPGFSLETFRLTLMVFGLYTALPALALLRIWRPGLRIAVVASVLPVSLAAAEAVASFEEYQFVKQNPDGTGPTARWTVSDNWLAYDAENRKLTGSD
jgi:hypothetical protein